MRNIYDFAARMASCNDCKTPDDAEVDLTLKDFTATQLAVLDNWLGKQSEEDLETLADGDEEDYLVIQASSFDPEVTHKVMGELFEALCG